MKSINKAVEISPPTMRNVLKRNSMRFAEMRGVRPMIERYPLAKAAAGYGRMMSGKAEFRVVLTI